jgi:hypothetical protein
MGEVGKSIKFVPLRVLIQIEMVEAKAAIKWSLIGEYLFFVTFFIVVTVCTPMNKKTSWEQDGLKGEVRTTRTMAYKYDLKGNWIERIEFLNDSAVRITERVIEYY